MREGFSDFHKEGYQEATWVLLGLGASLERRIQVFFIGGIWGSCIEVCTFLSPSFQKRIWAFAPERALLVRIGEILYNGNSDKRFVYER